MLGGGGALGRTVEVWCVRLMCGRHGMLVLASPARDVRTHADAREAESGVGAVPTSGATHEARLVIPSAQYA